MSYVLQGLWHERRRYLPATCAVAFSALLVALQCGMLLGTFSMVSIPVDHSTADLWVTCPDVVSVDVSRPIPLRWRARLSLPEIDRIEPYLQAFGIWHKPDGAAELAIVIGSRLGEDSLGAVSQLTPELRTRLAEPGTVVVDAADLKRLGIKGVGATAEINGRKVRVAGLVAGLKGLAGPYVFCSLETARGILAMNPAQTTFLLARHRREISPEENVPRWAFEDMSVFTREGFSTRSRMHWLLETGGGLSLLAAAVLGLLVGALITSQTLYAAAAASMKEFAVLRAMGIPRWRLATTVLAQSFWVGMAGLCLAAACLPFLARVIADRGANLMLPAWLLGGTACLTLLMTVASGLFALRSLRLANPVGLLK
ncbi:MAG: hypothetical protein IT428_26695 [Planctomycetaceae bacterium]|nr:hypothetical protein [Planctomycetaceae bacterium]